jgi:hypothetical protein
MSYSGSDLISTNKKQMDFQINGHVDATNTASPISAANLTYTVDSIMVNGRSVSLTESTDGNSLGNLGLNWTGPNVGITGSTVTTLATAISVALNAYYSIT